MRTHLCNECFSAAEGALLFQGGWETKLETLQSISFTEEEGAACAGTYK